jgi:PAS domain S-box-containing protein
VQGVTVDTTATKSNKPAFDEGREELERRINLRSKILAESIAGYRLLADNATDLITRTTVDGRRIYASPSSRRVLGYTPAEMTGLPARALIHPDDRQTVATAPSLLRGREADHQVIQYRARHKNGHWVWVEAAQQLVRDADEPDCLDIISVIRDISERRRLEEELRASEARLNLTMSSPHRGQSRWWRVIDAASRKKSPSHMRIRSPIRTALERTR